MPRQKGTAVQRAGKARVGKLKLCGAPKSNGEPCTQLAGKGTDHEGKGRCHWHEKKPGLIAAGRRLGTPVATTPEQAMVGVLHLCAGELAYVNEQVIALKEEEIWTESGGRNKWLRWRDGLMDRVAKYASAAAGMGIAERHTRMMEAQTRMFAVLLDAVIGDLDLTPKQRKAVGPAIRKNMSLIQGEAVDVTDK